MKKTGIVLLAFGGLACIGALTAGHSIFGPLVFIGIGLLLINRAGEKKE